MIWADNIEERTVENSTFRTVLWTGKHSQLTVMSIEPGEDIGVEKHDDVDQFLRIEAGKAQVQAGKAKSKLTEKVDVEADWAFIIPAGTWHNVVNTGTEPLKLYSIYSPANHPKGTVHETKADAEKAEASH